jgi:hypothetical protein
MRIFIIDIQRRAKDSREQEGETQRGVGGDQKRNKNLTMLLIQSFTAKNRSTPVPLAGNLSG